MNNIINSYKLVFIFRFDLKLLWSSFGAKILNKQQTKLWLCEYAIIISIFVVKKISVRHF